MTDSVKKPGAAKPGPYFRTSAEPKFSADSARRQGEITNLAFSLLGGREPAIAFLNHHNAELGARPIDLATDSAEGWASVERVMQRLANSDSSDQ
jgi:uncharacterized protein (DUF2384 family)